jgi:hypothetical protein
LSLHGRLAVLPLCSRPKKLDDVAHQDEVVNTLRRTLQSGNVSQQNAHDIHAHDDEPW